VFEEVLRQLGRIGVFSGIELRTRFEGVTISLLCNGFQSYKQHSQDASKINFSTRTSSGSQCPTYFEELRAALYTVVVVLDVLVLLQKSFFRKNQRPQYG